MGSYLLSVVLTLYVQFGGGFKELRQIFLKKSFSSFIKAYHPGRLLPVTVFFFRFLFKTRLQVNV